MSSTCSAIMVAPPWPEHPDQLYTCVQRVDHPGDHNRLAPADGCTAWSDHCPSCAEHTCACS